MMRSGDSLQPSITKTTDTSLAVSLIADTNETLTSLTSPGAVKVPGSSGSLSSQQAQSRGKNGISHESSAPLAVQDSMPGKQTVQSHDPNSNRTTDSSTPSSSAHYCRYYNYTWQHLPSLLESFIDSGLVMEAYFGEHKKHAKKSSDQNKLIGTKKEDGFAPLIDLKGENKTTVSVSNDNDAQNNCDDGGAALDKDVNYGIADGEHTTPQNHTGDSSSTSATNSLVSSILDRLDDFAKRQEAAAKALFEEHQHYHKLSQDTLPQSSSPQLLMHGASTATQKALYDLQNSNNNPSPFELTRALAARFHFRNHEHQVTSTNENNKANNSLSFEFYQAPHIPNLLDLPEWGTSLFADDSPLLPSNMPRDNYTLQISSRNLIASGVLGFAYANNFSNAVPAVVDLMLTTVLDPHDGEALSHLLSDYPFRLRPFYFRFSQKEARRRAEKEKVVMQAGKREDEGNPKELEQNKNSQKDSNEVSLKDPRDGRDLDEEEIRNRTASEFLPMFAVKPPPISIKDYYVRLLGHFRCSPECYIYSLCLLQKVAKKKKVLITKRSIHRLIFASLVVSAKMRNDKYYSMSFYAKGGGMPVHEARSLEKMFVVAIDYDCNVPPLSYLEMILSIRQHCCDLMYHKQQEWASSAWSEILQWLLLPSRSSLHGQFIYNLSRHNNNGSIDPVTVFSNPDAVGPSPSPPPSNGTSALGKPTLNPLNNPVVLGGNARASSNSKLGSTHGRGQSGWGSVAGSHSSGTDHTHHLTTTGTYRHNRRDSLSTTGTAFGNNSASSRAVRLQNVSSKDRLESPRTPHTSQLPCSNSSRSHDFKFSTSAASPHEGLEQHPHKSNKDKETSTSPPDTRSNTKDKTTHRDAVAASEPSILKTIYLSRKNRLGAKSGWIAIHTHHSHTHGVASGLFGQDPSLLFTPMITSMGGTSLRRNTSAAVTTSSTMSKSQNNNHQNTATGTTATLSSANTQTAGGANGNSISIDSLSLSQNDTASAALRLFAKNKQQGKSSTETTDKKARRLHRAKKERTFTKIIYSPSKHEADRSRTSAETIEHPVQHPVEDVNTNQKSTTPTTKSPVTDTPPYPPKPSSSIAGSLVSAGDPPPQMTPTTVNESSTAGSFAPPTGGLYSRQTWAPPYIRYAYASSTTTENGGQAGTGKGDGPGVDSRGSSVSRGAHHYNPHVPYLGFATYALPPYGHAPQPSLMRMMSSNTDIVSLSTTDNNNNNPSSRAPFSPPFDIRSQLSASNLPQSIPLGPVHDSNDYNVSPNSNPNLNSNPYFGRPPIHSGTAHLTPARPAPMETSPPPTNSQHFRPLFKGKVCKNIHFSRRIKTPTVVITREGNSSASRTFPRSSWSPDEQRALSSLGRKNTKVECSSKDTEETTTTPSQGRTTGPQVKTTTVAGTSDFCSPEGPAKDGVSPVAGLPLSDGFVFSPLGTGQRQEIQQTSSQSLASPFAPDGTIAQSTSNDGNSKQKKKPRARKDGVRQPSNSLRSNSPSNSLDEEQQKALRVFTAEEMMTMVFGKHDAHHTHHHRKVKNLRHEVLGQAQNNINNHPLIRGDEIYKVQSKEEASPNADDSHTPLQRQYTSHKSESQKDGKPIPDGKDSRQQHSLPLASGSLMPFAGAISSSSSSSSSPN